MLGSQHISPRYECFDCGRRYHTQESLNRHSRNHSQLVSYTCETCQATFKRKDLLNKHSRVHTSPRYRTRRACLSCSRLKIGCDTKIPCSRCVANARQCIYIAEKDKPPLSKTSPTSRAGFEPGCIQVSKGISEATDIEKAVHTPYEEPLLRDDGSILYSTELPNIIGLGNIIESPGCNPEYIPAFHHPSASQPGTIASGCTYNMPGGNHLPQPFQVRSHTRSGLQQLCSPDSDASMPISTTTYAHVGQSLVSSPPPGTRTPSAQGILEDIIDDAFLLHPNVSPQASRKNFWSEAASKVETAFGIRAPSSNTHLLGHFLALYFQHFHAKWPIIWKRGVIRDNLPPPLYLVMTAIGAACGEAAAVTYSAEMLKALAPRFLRCCFDQHHALEEVTILSQSLFLFQVALLYFGRTEAFLLCHQIGTLWIPVCRRFNIFDESQDPAATTRKAFISSETRRRLGMTCVHIDTSASAVLGYQPLLRPDEIKLRLPVPDYIWLSEDVDDIEAYQKHGIKDSRSHLFAHLVQSALYCDRTLPELQPGQLELLLHGILHHLWGADTPSETHSHHHDGKSPAFGSEPHCITSDGTGQIADVTRALKKCRKVLDKISTNAYTIPDRTSLLTSTYLHGIGVMRLHVDMLSLCKLARDCCRGVSGATSSNTALAAYVWANTEAALIAADAACYHWGRTADELLVPKEIRADFTIMAHIALLHSALIIWAFSSCRRDGLSMPLNRYRTSIARSQDNDLDLCSGNSKPLLEKFADLLLKIQHTQSSMRFSFAAYHSFVASLANTSFPLPW